MAKSRGGVSAAYQLMYAVANITRNSISSSIAAWRSVKKHRNDAKKISACSWRIENNGEKQRK